MKARGRHYGYISDKYFDMIKQEAKEEERPICYIINRIIERYYQEEEKKKEKLLFQLREGTRLTLKLPPL